MEKKRTLKSLKKELWELCKIIVRKRDGDRCFICGRDGLTGSNWHTGHLIPSSTCGAILRYDLRNLHSSCYNCNINLGGNGALFYRRVKEVYGIKFLDKIFLDKNMIIKADEIFYLNKINEYSKIQNWDKAKLFNYTKNYKNKTI